MPLSCTWCVRTAQFSSTLSVTPYSDIVFYFYIVLRLTQKQQHPNLIHFNLKKVHLGSFCCRNGVNRRPNRSISYWKVYTSKPELRSSSLYQLSNIGKKFSLHSLWFSLCVVPLLSLTKCQQRVYKNNLNLKIYIPKARLLCWNKKFCAICLRQYINKLSTVAGEYKSSQRKRLGRKWKLQLVIVCIDLFCVT